MRAIARPGIILLLALAVGPVLVLTMLAGMLWPEAGTAEANEEPFLSGVTAIAAGGSHTCALTTVGGVKCWGDNEFGQLGNGTTKDSAIPVDVLALGTTATAIAAGQYHTCAVTTQGGLKCWGDNRIGQLGDGTITIRTIPTDVIQLNGNIVAVSPSSSHTCAVTAGGNVICWGSNFAGELGIESTDTCEVPSMGTFPCSVTPVDVVSLGTTATNIATGFVHTCALTTAAGVKCWGSNINGELGDGNGGDSDAFGPTPVDVVGMTDGVAAIAAGNWHSCVVTTEGGVKCWGDNFNGQLGAGCSGTGCGSIVPVDVMGLVDSATNIGAGFRHTCALIEDGGVECWGLNASGQLGDATSTNHLSPMAVVELGSTAAAISAGDYHTCALTAAGTVKCWGANFAGQLGDGTTTDSATPVDVIADNDNDGCSDIQEQGSTAVLGGLRDPKSFWDFFDTPDGSNARDRAITIADIGRVAARFGTTGDPAGDPLSPPPTSGYHTAFDRTPLGPELWNLGPPNGAVTIQDIGLMVAQFGHTCI